jgi:general stress protein YciG
MDTSKQREIASRGGRAAHAQGTAHKFSPEEARLAGRKGGETVSGNREYMASIGRRGGEARHARRLARLSAAAAAQPATGTQAASKSSQSANNVETDGSAKDSDEETHSSSHRADH